MVSVMQPARVLVDPVDGVPDAVEARRWGLPLVVLMASVALAAVAWFLRWDAAGSVVQKLAMGGELMRATEVEIAEQIARAERMALVAGVAKGLFAMPLLVLMLAVAVKLTGWFIGRPAPFPKAFTTAAVALLPIALYYLLFSAVVLFQHSVSEQMRETLVPASLAQLIDAGSPKVARVLGAVDFFNLWSAVLLGLGFSHASGMRRGRAIALGLVLYLMYAGVFLVGLPALSGGRGGP